MKAYNNCIMVCVTPQQSCSRLIEVGSNIAKSKNLNLNIVCVAKPEKEFTEKENAALKYLYDYVDKFNADINLYFNENPAEICAISAIKNNAEALITGFPGENSNNFIITIHDLIPDTPIIMVDENMKTHTIAKTTKDEINEAKKNAERILSSIE